MEDETRTEYDESAMDAAWDQMSKEIASQLTEEVARQDSDGSDDTEKEKGKAAGSENEDDTDGSDGGKKKKKKKNDDSDESEEKTDWKKELRDWLIIIVSAVILAWALTHFVIMKTEVISGSMISTLNVDDRVVANRLAYVFSKPKRGDVIFFAYPDDESKTYVKRIIGLPGETVEIIQGKVYINNSDEPLDEPYLNEKMRKEDYGPYVVPESSYFVMGDNRNVSIDSRFWDNTFVTIDEIYGKAWFIYDTQLHKVKGTDDNEHVITNRLSYLFSSPKYGQLVTLKEKVDDHKVVKRIVAIPGDKVEVKNGIFYVNDSIAETIGYDIPSGNWGPYNVPEDRYMAVDDEYSVWGTIEEMCVAEKEIAGKAWFVFHIGFEGVSGARYATDAEQ